MQSQSGVKTVFPKPEEGRRLISAFLQIEDAKVRLALIKLAEAVGKSDNSRCVSDNYRNVA